MSDPVETPSLDALEAKLGYHFGDRGLLERALTHPSFCQGRPGGPLHNQRLEFLGDAVLGLALAEFFFTDSPANREGLLTRNRSLLARKPFLATLGRELALAPLIRMGPADLDKGFAHLDSSLADAIEAIIGAIFLDSSYETARSTILRWIGDPEKRLSALLDSHNPKGRLQEIVQPLHGNDAIAYEVLEESGPDHAKHFTVSVRVQGEAAGEGSGSSKKEAEENAARAALQTLDEAE